MKGRSPLRQPISINPKRSLLYSCQWRLFFSYAQNFFTCYRIRLKIAMANFTWAPSFHPPKHMCRNISSRLGRRELLYTAFWEVLCLFWGPQGFPIYHTQQSWGQQVNTERDPRRIRGDHFPQLTTLPCTYRPARCSNILPSLSPVHTLYTQATLLIPAPVLYPLPYSTMKIKAHKTSNELWIQK